MKSTIYNYKEIKNSIPESVNLVIVSKTHPSEAIKELYDVGHRAFGENKSQEILVKQQELPQDIEWHFIGHLQRNKVRQIVPFVHLIHGVDSLRLLKEINKQSIRFEKKTNCLLQFFIADEETKFGFELDEVREILQSDEFKEMQNIQICGVMGMATYTEDVEQIKAEFVNLKNIFDNLKSEFFAGDDKFKEISMGMTNDYGIAVEQGSTIVRIGSAIFGDRDYSK